MTFLSTPVLAEAVAATKTSFEPLFGNQWLALMVILVGIAVFMFAVAAVGRWVAATHPEEPKPVPPSIDVFAAIAAAVAVTFDGKARITSVQPIPTPVSIGTGQLQWSAEGRRQIYSSHKVR